MASLDQYGHFESSSRHIQGCVLLCLHSLGLIMQPVSEKAVQIIPFQEQWSNKERQSCENGVSLRSTGKKTLVQL